MLHWPGPERVTNVRVFVYRPNTDPNVLTGLVIWDEVEFALNYTVTISQGEVEILDVCLPQITLKLIPPSSIN